MESTFLDFVDFDNNQSKNSKNYSENKKRNLIFYIISLSIVIILGIFCFERKSKISKLKKTHNDLYEETLTLKKNSEDLYSRNMEKNKLVVQVFNDMKAYKEQFEKDEKEVEDLKEKNIDLKKQKEQLTLNSENIRSKVREIKSELENNMEKLTIEKNKNAKLAHKYQILKEELEKEEE